MALISITTPNDGDVVSAASVSNPLNTIVSAINGNLDANNIAANAITAAKIANSAVTTVKIDDAAVTSPKLAEAFFRGRYQSDTTNSAPTGLTVQFGWGYITGNNTPHIAETVAYPASFSSVPIVLGTFIASRPTTNGTPTGPDWFTVPIGGNTAIGVQTSNITVSNFILNLNRSDSTSLGSTSNWGYTWIAIGAV